MSDETQQPQTIHLVSPGSIPGIPGDHAPGDYIVDYVARTITPVHPPTTGLDAQPAETETETQLQAEVAQLQEELASLTQPSSPQEAN